MNNKDQYFKGQQDEETLICFARHHWIFVIKEFIYFSLFLGIIILCLVKIELIKEVLRGNRELKILFVTSFLIATLYFHRFFIKLINYFLDIEIITNRRIVEHKKTLFFKDTIDSIDMGQIQNIEMVIEGLLPNLLGFGDIRVYLNASSAIKTFPCLPNAKFHFRCINRQRDAIQQLMFERDHGNLQKLTTHTHAMVNATFIDRPVSSAMEEEED